MAKTPASNPSERARNTSKKTPPASPPLPIFLRADRPGGTCPEPSATLVIPPLQGAEKCLAAMSIDTHLHGESVTLSSRKQSSVCRRPPCRTAQNESLTVSG